MQVTHQRMHIRPDLCLGAFRAERPGALLLVDQSDCNLLDSVAVPVEFLHRSHVDVVLQGKGVDLALGVIAAKCADNGLLQVDALHS